MADLSYIPSLLVLADEVLVIRVESDIDADQLVRLRDFLNNGPLHDRYVLFVGEVEFAKVKV